MRGDDDPGSLRPVHALQVRLDKLEQLLPVASKVSSLGVNVKPLVWEAAGVDTVAAFEVAVVRREVQLKNVSEADVNRVVHPVLSQSLDKAASDVSKSVATVHLQVLVVAPPRQPRRPPEDVAVLIHVSVAPGATADLELVRVVSRVHDEVNVAIQDVVEDVANVVPCSRGNRGARVLAAEQAHVRVHCELRLPGRVEGLEGRP
mmetsp:Transcript_23968/g.47710  ORF Transcript_23968/g.47710 Transcript_23968/m.47710 type:complete len:204 (-) Transcript_23968:13-624(-)